MSLCYLLLPRKDMGITLNMQYLGEIMVYNSYGNFFFLNTFVLN